MKKLTILITAVAFSLVTSFANAGTFNFGVMGAVNKVEATGTERTSNPDSSLNNAKAQNASVITGSVYAEYELGEIWPGFAVGFEYTPGSADVSESIKSRAEVDTSRTGTAAATTASVTRKAQAEVENFQSIYAEIPLYEAAFVKIGMASIDVNTLENLGGNSGKYGNKTIDGITLGVGVKGNTTFSDNMHWKLLFEKTNFDQLTLKSTGNSVAAEVNTIEADLDVTSLKLGLGYKF